MTFDALVRIAPHRWRLDTRHWLRRNWRAVRGAVALVVLNAAVMAAVIYSLWRYIW